MIKITTEVLKSMKHAFRGIVFTYHGEKNFRREVFAGFVFLCTSFFFDLNVLERILVLFFIVLPLSFEMLNTAIEYSWNKLHPEMHESVGKIKDIAAGAVLLIGLFSYLSVIVIFYTSL